MTVRELLTASGLTPSPGRLDIPCSGVTHDSREVTPGKLFVALRGLMTDGAAYAAQAIAAKQPQSALAIAAIAAERFPDSHDARLIHGLLLERTGRFAAAASEARRALAIDANSRQARSLLERTEKKPAAMRKIARNKLL